MKVVTLFENDLPLSGGSGELDDDDSVLLRDDDAPQDHPSHSHAKFVEGGVGMVRAGKALPMRIVAGLRNGVLVINLSDGGSLYFYKIFKRPLRYVKEHLRLNENATKTRMLGNEMGTQISSSSIFLRSLSSRVSIVAAAEESIFHRDKAHGRDKLDVAENMKKKIDKVSVFASTQDFVEPAEMPYIYIPACVPWRFKSVNNLRNNSFQIVVPPYTMGDRTKRDDRVKIMSHRDKIKNMRKIKTFVDGIEVTYVTVLKLGGGGGNGDGNDEDSDYASHYYKDDSDAGAWAASAQYRTESKSNFQVFQFCCDKDELAVYAKASQSLGRVFADNKWQTTAKAIIENNVRVRSAGGMEVAAQLRILEKTNSVANIRDRRFSSVDELEFRVFPLHVYPYTWMTKNELAVEITRTSKNFVDLRSNVADEIGCIRVEVIQCIGLPKMDKYSLTDAFCCVVCGSAAFLTDVIPDNLNPGWLPLTRRACILPLKNAYSQVYVGVFDYDGEKEDDDFIGRVVIDTQRLKSGFSYDITLPLRHTSRVYYRKKLGSVRLRLELHWTAGERAALLSYLPKYTSDVTKRLTNSPLKPAATVVCPDAKSFATVGFTVYGEDVPGKYSAHIKNAISREVTMVNKLMFHRAKTMIRDVAQWKNPLLSMYMFWAWMYMVLYNAFDNVPSFILSLIFIALLRNYVKYNVNSAVGSLYGHRTIVGMLGVLLFNRDDSNVQISEIQRLGNRPFLQHFLLKIFGMTTFTAKQKNSWRTENHAEFPFSSGVIYPKVSPDEAAKAKMWDAAQQLTNSDDKGAANSTTVIDWDGDEDDGIGDEEDWSFENGVRGDLRQSIKKGLIIVPSKRTELSESALRRPRNDITEEASLGSKTDGDNIEIVKSPSEDSFAGEKKRHRRKLSINNYDNIATLVKKSCKGAPVSTQNGPILPEQNMGIKAKTSRTIISQIEGMHAKASKATLHLFDDRVFVADDKAEAERLLQINVTNNPIAKKLNPIMGAFLKLIDIELCTFRALFNILMWKDPFLSFWMTLIVFFLMVVLLVFPWRYFFFITGFIGLGPQNYFLADWFEAKYIARQQKKKANAKSSLESLVENNDLGESPLLHRNNVQMKPDGKHREIIVPSVPLRYNRFYGEYFLDI